MRANASAVPLDKLLEAAIAAAQAGAEVHLCVHEVMLARSVQGTFHRSRMRSNIMASLQVISAALDTPRSISRKEGTDVSISSVDKACTDFDFIRLSPKRMATRRE